MGIVVLIIFYVYFIIFSIRLIIQFKKSIDRVDFIGILIEDENSKCNLNRFLSELRDIENSTINIILLNKIIRVKTKIEEKLKELN